MSHLETKNRLLTETLSKKTDQLKGMEDDNDRMTKMGLLEEYEQHIHEQNQEMEVMKLKL